MGFAAIAIAPVFGWGLFAEQRRSLLACVCVVGALFNAYVWFILRDSYPVALAELRHGQARERQRRARARGVVDPTIDRAVDDAEREYFSTRYWLQER